MATVIKTTVQKEKISITDGKKLYFIDSKLESLVACVASNESAYKKLSPIWGLTQTANFTLVLQYIKCLINSKVRDKPVHVYQVKVISATVND